MFFCQNWSEHQWDLFKNRRSYNGKLLKQHIRQDSLQGKEMKIMKRQVALKGPVLKPVLDGPSPVQVWLWMRKV